MKRTSGKKSVKRYLLLTLCAAMAALMALNLCGCGMEISAQAADLMEGITANDVEGTPADQKFIKAESELFTKLFKAASETSRGQNVMVSPLSVQLALAMTANGADSDTLSEMETLLGGEIPLSELNKYLFDYMKTLTSGEKFKLSIADSIWFRDDEDRLTVKKDFLQTNADYYKAEAYKSPFDDGTLDDINKWVSDNTDGMIDKILEQISADDIMYLINAIVFDAEWSQKFEPGSEWDKGFTAWSGEKRTVDMMTSTEDRYIDTGTATGFIKSYAGGKYSFAALLPNEGVDVFDYVAGLSEDGLTAAVNSAVDETVVIDLPKFSYDYKLVMNDILCDLGIPTAFDASKADFSRIGRSSYGNIYIGEVLHKTYIAVDEDGTKAAAVTEVAMKESGMLLTDLHFVTLDRPFVYMIFDNDTSLPIFVGVLADTGK